MPDDVTAPVTAKLVPVAAPITGVVNTIEVLVQALMLPLVTVPSTGVVNTIEVLRQALMLPLATVPKAGVTIVGLVNSSVLLMLLVVPAWTNGTISAALMTVATGKPEMATVVIIKSSQRKCCSVDDWRLCRKALPSHRQGC